MTSIFRANFLCRAGVAALILAASIPAGAQTVPYDPNCKEIAQTEAQEMVDETCAMHAGCRFFVIAPINAGCKAVNFIRNLGKTDAAFDNSTLIDGATYDLPRPTKFQQMVSEIKASVHSALGTAAKRDVVQTDDGRVAYYEGGHINGGSGSGAMIYADGTMARGTFDAKYKLSGTGELITPDGKVRAGEFKDNQLSGAGFVSEKDGNRTVLIEGTFDGDTPVGEVIRNYADGSRTRELWENGKMVARGDRAPKGKVPPPIRRPETRLAAAGTRDEGLFLIKEGKGGKLWELRCRGRAVVLFVSAEKPVGKTCKQEVQQAGADVNRGDIIERTLGPGKTTPVGRIMNPLIVQGPPWICSNEIDVFMAAWGRRTRGQGMLSPDQYWQRNGFSAIAVITYGSDAPVRQLYQQYEASHPNIVLQPVAYRDNYGQQYREAYFRDGAAMRQLAAAFDGGAGSDEVGATMGIGACVARYLADNARD